MFRYQIVLFTLIFIFVGCSGDVRLPVENSPRGVTDTSASIDTDATDTVSWVPTMTSEAVPASPTPARSNPISGVGVSPTLAATIAASPVAPVVSPEEASELELAESRPPVRDDVRLAVAFRGLSEASIKKAEPVDGPLQAGAQQEFTVLDVVHNTVSDIDAELLAVSNYAYFWFDAGPGSIIPEEEELRSTAETFDQIYEGVVAHFGSERNPGVDGDPRVHIVHASPIALCGVTEETVDQCPFAGLVNATDFLPKEVDPRSNEREMFVMNAQRFGGDHYLGVLAHEFRHMIEDNYDETDKDWEIEGSATLAAQLLGLPSSGVARGNMFLENPDQQLNSWTEDGTAPFYGQGYVLNRYIYDRLGKDRYLEFATSSYPGLMAVDAVAEANDLELNGESLWLDWLVALAIHDDPQSPEIYRFESTGLNTAAVTSLANLPVSFQTDVRQYAADYYELPKGMTEITFKGNHEVPLLNEERVSGGRFWLAQRANYSNPRLTRAFDLREVDQATLNYDFYADIEQGYDFAYVSVSLNEGRTWLPLAGEQMQGLDPEDNPAGSALADRFYTGRTRQWLHDSIDLSPFTGHEILLRFEYVTDPILTYGGLAVDDIAIPEIDFFDNVEGDAVDWTAEGFTRTTPYLPQRWHIQMISHSDNGPAVHTLPVIENGELSMTFEEGGTKEKSILIVAATAPMTLEPATYELRFD